MGPDPHRPRHAPLLLLVLVTATALAGCVLPGTDGGDGEPAGLLPGDLVQVRFIERFENGTVFNSTAGSDLPANATLGPGAEAAGHRPVWWLFWTDFSVFPEGEDVLTQVQMLDLDADGRIESMSRFRHDVEGTDAGQRRTDEQVALWRLPPGVEDPVRLPARGLHEAMARHTEGQVLEGIRLPPETGFGFRSEEATLAFPRLRADEPRWFRNLTVDTVRQRSNLTDDTAEGDVLRFRHLGLGARMEARVEALDGERLDLYLLVEEGQSLPFHGFWDATVVRVDNATFDLRHDPAVGHRFRSGGQTGRVETVNATHVEVDFNDPRADRTMVYDVEVLRITRVRQERDLWSRAVDPAGPGDEVHDVAWIAPSMPAVATSRGAFFTPTANWGDAWFTLSPDLDGREVLALAVAPDRSGHLYASVAGQGVLRSDDTGRTWTAAGPGPGGAGGAGGADGTAGTEGSGGTNTTDGTDTAGETAQDGEEGPAPVELTVSPADPAVLYARAADGTIHRSDDGAESWSAVGTAPGGVQGLAAGGGSPDELWAATATGLRRSTDAGANWTNASFRFRAVWDVTAPGGDLLYAAAGHAVYRSVDGGASWQAQGNVGARRLHALPAIPAWLLAGGSGQSLTLSQQGGAAWRNVPT